MSFFTRKPEFVRTQGFCFFTEDEIDVITISLTLRDAARFFQATDPNAKLYRYDDWWEHDGFHSEHGSLDFSDLLALLSTPRTLLESTPDEHAVFVGIAPEDSRWYMRYRIDWNDEETGLTGRFAVILNPMDAVAFRKIESISSLAELASDIYYSKVIC